MDASEERRERLKALRAEAAQAQVSITQNASTVPGSLSNPSIDPSGLPPLEENSPPPAGSDFHTDPVSALSGNERRNSNNIRSPRGHTSRTIVSVFQSPTLVSVYQLPTLVSVHQLLTPPSEQSRIPSMCNQCCGSRRFGFPSCSPRAGFSGPGYGHRGSAGPNTRRGGYNRFNRSPGSGQSSGRGGWSSGRGRGFHDSARDHP